MKKNMGAIDRGVRVLLALAIAVLYFTGVISGTVAIVCGVIALVFLFTGCYGSCGLYTPFGFSTRKQSKT
ncbi:MAG: DUF2892 domain-containing protein [Gemmatimonadetes bacterium]|nr:DUF2892 domain-containing protein [Gemmatimonadota bacterium]